MVIPAANIAKYALFGIGACTETLGDKFTPGIIKAIPYSGSESSLARGGACIQGALTTDGKKFFATQEV